MALGYLFILFVFIILISILGILGLYFVKNQKVKNILFYSLFALSLVISFMNVTSLPNNYIKNQKVKNILFYSLFALSLVISFMNVTSLPNNYIFQRVFGLFIGILSIISVFIKLKLPNKANIAYLVMSLSIVLSVFDLIF